MNVFVELRTKLNDSGSDFISLGRADAWAVESNSDPWNLYYVLHTHGLWLCSCPGFRYRGRDCRHIRKVKRGAQTRHPQSSTTRF